MLLPRARKHISSPVGVSILELEEALETILHFLFGVGSEMEAEYGTCWGILTTLWQSQSEDLICQFVW